MAAADTTGSSSLAGISETAPVFEGYAALDPSKREIRLLDIGPDLECTLRHVDLDDDPEYLALSYYWGAPGKELPITVNGRTVKLRKTLHRFFEVLQQKFTNLTVWVDVLCTNQRNKAEQGQQVAMMGEIYKKASAVYAWLGEGDADTDYALDYILARSHAQRNASDDTTVDRYLKKLLLRPYFERAWIVQEFSLNAMLYMVCGERIVKWEDLSRATTTLASIARVSGFLRHTHLDEAPERGSPKSRDRPALRGGWQQLDQLREERQATSSRSSIYELVKKFSYTQCVDPRDKVYAFRALADDSETVTPDYNAPALNAIFQVSRGICIEADDDVWHLIASLLRHVKLTEEQVLTGLRYDHGFIFKWSLWLLSHDWQKLYESDLRTIQFWNWLVGPDPHTFWHPDLLRKVLSLGTPQNPRLNLLYDLFIPGLERTRYMLTSGKRLSWYLFIDLQPDGHSISDVYFINTGGLRTFSQSFKHRCLVPGDTGAEAYFTRQFQDDSLNIPDHQDDLGAVAGLEVLAGEVRRMLEFQQVCKGRVKICRRKQALKGSGAKRVPLKLEFHMSAVFVVALVALQHADGKQWLPQSFIDYARNNPPKPDEAECDCEVETLGEDGHDIGDFGHDGHGDQQVGDNNDTDSHHWRLIQDQRAWFWNHIRP